MKRHIHLLYLFAFALNFSLMPNTNAEASAKNVLPQCVHWTTSFISTEFIDKAEVKGKSRQRLYLHKANPQLCAQKELGMGEECNPKSYVIPGDKITLGHTCGRWTWIQFEDPAKKGKRGSRTEGWVEKDRLKALPLSAEDAAERQKWYDQVAADESKQPPLANAVSNGDISAVLKILDSDQDNKQVQWALGMGIVFRQDKIIDIAFKRGAKPDINDRAHKCSLSMLAIQDIAVVRALIKGGADVNCNKDAQGFTPLMHVFRVNRANGPYAHVIAKRKPIIPASDPLEVAKALIDAGASLEIRNDFGKTALRSSLEINNVDIAAFLLDKGADPNSYTDHGAQSGNTSLMEALDWYTLTFDPSMIKLLLEHGANPNYQNKLSYDEECDKTTSGKCTFNGQTVLTRAAADGRLTIVKLLLQHGADPSLARADGILPAEIARQAGHKDIASLIEEYIHNNTTPPN